MAKNQVRIGVGVDDKATKPIKGIRDAFDQLQKQGGKGFAIGAGAAITAKGFSLLDSAASAAIATIGDSVRAASDLNETISKGSVIFGDGADAVEAWADTAADAFGQSKREAIDAASGFAGLFKTVGIELDQATGMSQKLTELGSDLASFFNTDVQTALGALKSGLNGESEPLRAFNVFLSETAVSAKLAEMGIEKVGGAFTESQKATARYALILEQTGAAQGDFARTSDGLANSQKTLDAQMENLKAEIGSELLPVMVELAQFAKDTLVPAIRDLVDIAKEAGPVFGFLGDAARGLIDPLGVLRDNAREEAEAIAAADRAHRDFLATSGGLPPAVRGTGDALAETADDADDLAEGLKDVANRADDARKALDDLSGELFDTDITTGELAKAQQELAELVKEGPGHEPGDWTIWRGDIAEAKKRIFDLNAELAQGTGPEAFMAFLDREEAKLGTTDDAARRYLDTLRKITTLQGGTTSKSDPGAGGGSTRGRARASGGPVAEGVPYTVGEFGRETFVPDTNGTIVPTGKGVGGGTTIFNLTFTGRVGDKKEDVVAALLAAARFDRG